MPKRKPLPASDSQVRRTRVREEPNTIGLTLPPAYKPFYETQLGYAVLGDSLELMRHLPNECVDLVMTSPPFALKRKKEYGNKADHEYVEWFLEFGRDVHRLLKPTGSFVIDIGGTWNTGKPTRSLYQYELLLRLAESFCFAQEFFWHNPAKLPSPAEWVTVRRIRATDAVNTIWWLSRTEWPKADNRRVLRPYSDSMRSLLKNGYKPKLRPSGHDISDNFKHDHGGSIPHNLLQISNTESNSLYLRKCAEKGIKPHPARFPLGVPAFFIKFLTDPGDLVLDIFAGSNVTGKAAEDLGRRWLAMELNKEYLATSKYRFSQQLSLVLDSRGTLTDASSFEHDTFRKT
ncbi:MAG: site-specific DNA-methyltransferase [Gemmatimonadaceae bacterium]